MMGVDETIIPNVLVAIMLIGDIIALTLIFLLMLMVLHVLIRHRKPNWLYGKSTSFKKKRTSSSHKSVSIMEDEVVPSVSVIPPTPRKLQTSHDEEFFV